MTSYVTPSHKTIEINYRQGSENSLQFAVRTLFSKLFISI